MDLSTIINKLELNPSIYSNSEIILKIFDNKNKKDQISINNIDDNSYKILIKSLNAFEEEITAEIKLIKDFLNDNDNFKYIFSILILIKNYDKIGGENEEIENLKNKINELKLNINQKDKEIKDELKEKDIIIQKLNEKIINQENIINNINEKINNIKNNLINDINNQNDRINKMMSDKIEIMNKKYDKFIGLINNNNKIQNKEFENKLLIKENEINNKIKVLINYL